MNISEIEALIKANQPIHLDMGCGNYIYLNYIGVDPWIDHPRVLKEDMSKVPLPANSVAKIYSSHSLEHRVKYDIVPILQEWERLLKPDGEIRIRVPNLIWACTNWLKHQTNDWHMDVIYGLCTNPGEEHRTGFTAPIMQNYIDHTGLKTVQYNDLWTHDQHTMEFVLTK